MKKFIPIVFLIFQIIYGTETKFFVVDSLYYNLSGRALLGEANDIVVNQNCAFVALSTGLLVLDVSQSDTIVFVSQTYLNPQMGSFCESKIFYENDRVYFTTGSLLYILDVSNPSSPQYLCEYDFGGAGCISDVVVKNDTIILAEGNTNIIKIFDFDGINSLNELSSFNVSDPRKIDLNDDFLYIADGKSGDLIIYDISDFNSPVYVNKYDGWDVGCAVSVNDSIACFANGRNGLKLIDIRNPLNLIEVGVYNPSYFASDVLIFGNLAFLASILGNVEIIDFSIPSSPTVICNANAGGSSLYIINNNLYATRSITGFGDVGVFITDITNPQSPFLTGYFFTGANYNDITSFNGNIYVVGWDFGIQIFPDDGIYHPNDIVTVSVSDAEELVIKNNLGFLLGFQGLAIMDWSNPINPTQLSFISTQYEPQEVVIRDSILYVACGVEMSVGNFPGEFRIYNISDINNPQPFSSINSPISPFYDIVIYNNNAFILDYFEGIRVFNIDDINNPYEEYLEAGLYQRIKINENYLFAASANEIFIYDITSAPFISLVSQKFIDNDLWIYDLLFEEDILHIGTSKGLYAFDISDPTICTLIGQIDLPALEEAYYLYNNKIYIATYDRGVFILSPTLSSLNEEEPILPKNAILYQNYPNPFNNQTKIDFYIPFTSKVDLNLYTIQGELVDEVSLGVKQAGLHSINYDVRNLSSGLYFYELKLKNSSLIQKAILIK